MSSVCITRPTLVSVTYVPTTSVYATHRNSLVTREGDLTTSTYTTCAPVIISRTARTCTSQKATRIGRLPGQIQMTQVPYTITAQGYATRATTFYTTSCAIVATQVTTQTPVTTPPTTTTPQITTSSQIISSAQITTSPQITTTIDITATPPDPPTTEPAPRPTRPLSIETTLVITIKTTLIGPTSTPVSVSSGKVPIVPLIPAIIGAVSGFVLLVLLVFCVYNKFLKRKRSIVNGQQVESTFDQTQMRQDLQRTGLEGIQYGQSFGQSMQQLPYLQDWEGIQHGHTLLPQVTPQTSYPQQRGPSEDVQYIRQSDGTYYAAQGNLPQPSQNLSYTSPIVPIGPSAITVPLASSQSMPATGYVIGAPSYPIPPHGSSPLSSSYNPTFVPLGAQQTSNVPPIQLSAASPPSRQAQQQPSTQFYLMPSSYTSSQYRGFGELQDSQ